MCIYMCVYMVYHVTVCVCRSEDNLSELILSFHLMGPKKQTQITKFCDRCLNLLSHLAGQIAIFF